jgi:hypothetical protein
MRRGVVRVAVDVRHHRHTCLEARKSKRQLREDQQRDADDQERVPMLLGQGGGPVRPEVGLCCHVSESDSDDDDVQGKVDRH